MAVPKKRTSKSKKNIRKSVWKNKAKKQAIKALSIAKYVVGLDLNKSYVTEKKETTSSTTNSGFSE
jgi:ribosomal protein L32